MKSKNPGLRSLKVIITSTELEALDIIGKAFGFRNREQTVKRLIFNSYQFVSGELRRLQEERIKLKEGKTDVEKSADSVAINPTTDDAAFEQKTGSSGEAGSAERARQETHSGQVPQE